MRVVGMGRVGRVGGMVGRMARGMVIVGIGEEEGIVGDEDPGREEELFEGGAEGVVVGEVREVGKWFPCDFVE